MYSTVEGMMMLTDFGCLRNVAQCMCRSSLVLHRIQLREEYLPEVPPMGKDFPYLTFVICITLALTLLNSRN